MSQDSNHRENEHARAEDPGEYNQRKRLEAIASAREQAREYKLYAESEGLEKSAVRGFFSAVQNYAMELQWPMKRHGSETYSQTSLGKISVSPPAEIQRSSFGEIYVVNDFGERLGRVVGSPDLSQKHQPVRGVLPSDTPGVSFLNLPPTWTEEWSFTIDVTNDRPQKKTFSQTVGIPFGISVSAFQLCNAFIDEIELDIRVEKDKPHMKL